MYTENDIILAVDYHDKTITGRRFNCNTGEERIVKMDTTQISTGSKDKDYFDTT